MTDNLNPQQFAREADRFDRWAKSKRAEITQRSEVSPGHSAYAPDDGRMMSRLHSAHEWLIDSASADFYARKEGFGGDQGLNAPLHDLLPYHHDLVDMYQRERRR